MEERIRIVAIGEVLWDIVGTDMHLGGAPFNFIYHATSLGCEGHIISRVGSDSLGDGILSHTQQLGIPSELIQRDSEHPTGTVEVVVDDAGIPGYQIAENVAWDFIELTAEGSALVETADVICYGSLAQRSVTSRESIIKALSLSRPDCLHVFDINLRQNYYTRDMIVQNLKFCNVLKLNQDEMRVLQGMFTLPDDIPIAARELLKRFALGAVVLTEGEAGARAWSAEEEASVAGRSVEVADTIGCGDAFTAAFVAEYVSGGSLADALEVANAAAAYVATQHGGTPDFSKEIVEAFIMSE